VLRLVIIAQKTAALAELCSEIYRSGFSCAVLPPGNGLVDDIANRRPDLVLVEIDSKLPTTEIGELIQVMKEARALPVIAMVPEEVLDSLDGQLNVDDFVTSPYDARELSLRVKRLLDRARKIDSGELIKCDGLLIDLARYEVTVAGRIVELTFKEYELLKLLASNQGRVYTREALLNQVWGYDYFGGDRTVDVHIRRLRSKIEDQSRTFIETVRSIGYRFKKHPSHPICNQNLTHL
jgi:DNA-binding response OmpR family regulator